MLRKIAAVGAGVIVATLIMLVLQWVGDRVVPVPAQADPSSPDRPMVPLPAFAVLLLAWFLGPLGGGVIANRLANDRWPCWVIAALVACGTAYQLLGHAPWMVIIGIVAPVVAAWVVSRWVPKRA